MAEKDLEFVQELRRLPTIVSKMMSELSPERQKKYSGQLTWFFKKADEFIESTGISFIAPSGVYDVGLPVAPLNIADFDKDAELVIDQVIEPVVMYEGKVIKAGTVLLKKAK